MTPAGCNPSNDALVSLEAAMAATRSGFGCIFSTSDEYETAVIAERREHGHYDRSPNNRWPMVVVVGCVLAVAGAGFLFRDNSRPR